MHEGIRRIEPEREYFTAEQCHILELSNSADDAAVSIARARVTPGVTTHWHRLIGIAERYVIVEGRGIGRGRRSRGADRRAGRCRV